ncbi:MAG: methionyl-tRNA formyltransferase [Candidatus Zixiibacteriota bacterium]
MNVVYMGTPEFARGPLDHLAHSRHRILAVVTGPDKPAGRGRHLLTTPVKQHAQKLGLPVLTPASLKSDELYERLAELKADLFVVVAFRILPERLFTLPRLGSMNVHASLLPRYRGAAPINWALINGDTETGLTSFFLRKDVDTGDMILQEKVAINDDDIFDTLYTRLSSLAGPFLVRTLEMIESGNLQPIQQDDRQAGAAPKITPENSFIDFGFPARNVRNFVRGLSTRPGAATSCRGKRLKVLACNVADIATNSDTRPGTVLAERKRLLVQCSHSAVELTRVVPEGKGEMDGVSFINGFRLQPGEVLGEPVTQAREHL